MYSKLDIVTIFKNCSTMEEMYQACDSFAFLFNIGAMIRSEFIVRTSLLRFRELSKKDSI